MAVILSSIADILHLQNTGMDIYSFSDKIKPVENIECESTNKTYQEN